MFYNVHSLSRGALTPSWQNWFMGHGTLLLWPGEGSWACAWGKEVLASFSWSLQWYAMNYLLNQYPVNTVYYIVSAVHSMQFRKCPQSCLLSFPCQSFCYTTPLCSCGQISCFSFLRPWSCFILDILSSRGFCLKIMLIIIYNSSVQEACIQVYNSCKSWRFPVLNIFPVLIWNGFFFVHTAHFYCPPDCLKMCTHDWGVSFLSFFLCSLLIFLCLSCSFHFIVFCFAVFYCFIFSVPLHDRVQYVRQTGQLSARNISHSAAVCILHSVYNIFG